MNITLETVTFVRRGARILDGVSMEIPGSGLTCLLGANGAGKTTLLRILTGETLATSGGYFIGDIDASVLSQRELSHHFAVIPQNVAVPQYFSVGELVALGRYVPRRTIWRSLSVRDREVVQSCLAQCQMEPLASRPFEQLSGGEQQRGWLAFGLAQEKEFLLLDETLGGMDFFTRRAFFQLLRQVSRQGRGVLLTSHDLSMVEEFADKVIVLSAGSVSYEGPPQLGLQDLLISSRHG
jgi:ABC-type cobalamin/Fe3+-siderophores transport system ATPase subunit